MSSVIMLTKCNREDDFWKDSISKDELNVDIDYKGIEKAVKTYRDAFELADQVLIDELTIDETLELAGESPCLIRS